MTNSLLFKASAIVEILDGLAFLAARAGLCIYNVGAAIVFIIIGASGGMNGILLWPATVLHALIGAMMLWVILAAPGNEKS